MSLFLPKGKRAGKTYSFVLDTAVGTTYVDSAASPHIAEWVTPLGVIQKQSICILEQVTIDTNAPVSSAVVANMFAIRLVGAGSPDSYDSTKNGPDNVLLLSAIPFTRVGYVPDGVPISPTPAFSVMPRSRNGVICGPGYNLQTIRIALEEYGATYNASVLSRIVYHLVWMELEECGSD